MTSLRTSTVYVCVKQAERTASPTNCYDLDPLSCRTNFSKLSILLLPLAKFLSRGVVGWSAYSSNDIR